MKTFEYGPLLLNIFFIDVSIPGRVASPSTGLGLWLLRSVTLEDRYIYTADEQVENAADRDTHEPLACGYYPDGSRPLVTLGIGRSRLARGISIARTATSGSRRFRQPGGPHAHTRYRHSYDRLSRLTVANHTTTPAAARKPAPAATLTCRGSPTTRTEISRR